MARIAGYAGVALAPEWLTIDHRISVEATKLLHYADSLRQTQLSAVLSPSSKVGGYFLSIPTELHTAPIASMVFGRVVKIKNTCRVFALLDQSEIRRTQQVTRRDRQ